MKKGACKTQTKANTTLIFFLCKYYEVPRDQQSGPESKGWLFISRSPRRKKITKQDFLNADKNKNSGILKSENNPDDPLSQLDPLWSLK